MVIRFKKIEEDFIKEMLIMHNEVTTSDLQGIVQAFCMSNNVDFNEMLEAIYERVDQN